MLVAIAFLPTIVYAQEKEVFIKNNYDVEITKEEYDILKRLGYPEEVINNITQSYLDYVLENKDTLVIQKIENGSSNKPYSSDEYPTEGLYQDFETWGKRTLITSVNYSTYNGNNVYEVVNFVSWLNLPNVRSLDLNMFTFDDFYITPLRDTLYGEQFVSYATCPNGHREPDTTIYYNSNGSRVIWGAEAVGYGMDLVNDYEGKGKCVKGIASMIKVKFDNTRSDVRSFYVTGTYHHMTTNLSASAMAKAVAKAVYSRSLGKGLMELAKELASFKYDRGNFTGIQVENARW